MSDEQHDEDVAYAADRAAIVEVLHRYAQGLDHHDADMVKSCFMPDAEYGLGGNVLRGPELRVIWELDPETIKRSSGLDRFDVSTHAIADVIVDVEGDTATAQSVAVAYLVGPRDGQQVMLIRGLRYRDRLVRVDGRWRIARRDHEFLWMFEAVPTKVRDA